MGAPRERTAGWIFTCALLVWLAVEVLRVYWIMPLPGSQRGNTIDAAYALHRWIWVARVLAGGTLLWGFVRLVSRGGWLARILAVLGVALLSWVAYQANGPMSADVMFRQPGRLDFAGPGRGAVAPEALVVGVVLTDGSGLRQARAYPIQYIGYHHQVRDVVAGQPVMITYCTVCRTGRVFSPRVDGAVESFRLVGMDHWNAMFEDSRTGSWWRQANGEAITGPLEGQRLEEIPSQQMTWAAWSALHPESDVMQPDPAFAEAYAHMVGFAEGTKPGALTGRDPASWQRKSWVVGVVVGDAARAFDWNELVRERVITDRVGDQPVILLLGADGASFRVFASPLGLAPTEDPSRFRDRTTGDLWDESGLALDGPQAGTRLATVPAYQEFWHSWQDFHPGTSARGR